MANWSEKTERNIFIHLSSLVSDDLDIDFVAQLGLANNVASLPLSVCRDHLHGGQAVGDLVRGNRKGARGHRCSRGRATTASPLVELFQLLVQLCSLLRVAPRQVTGDQGRQR